MKPLIVANWKMNPPSLKEALVLARKITKEEGMKNVEVVVTPPFLFLSHIRKILKKFKLGAQDMSWEEKGAFTGEVSPSELSDLGVSFCIVGHSERRTKLGETDEMINKKVKTAFLYGISPILCIGEQERTGNEIPSVVGEQLKKALKDIKKSMLKNLIVAYEPVWAISTNSGARADTPDNAFRAALYIRKVISSLFDRKSSEKVKIIYGGSVNSENVASFLKEGKMQGALVGAACLDPKEFGKILKEVSKI